MVGRVPDEVLEPMPAGLWKPMMWAYCEGAPIGFVVIIAGSGPLIVKTTAATVTAVIFFAIAWFGLRKLGAWDPKAWRVLRRARRYRSRRSALIPARATWGSPSVRLVTRRH